MNTYNSENMAVEESIRDPPLDVRARIDCIGASILGNDALRIMMSSFMPVPSVMKNEAFNQNPFSCNQQIPLLSSLQTNALPESTPIEMLNRPPSCKQPCLLQPNQPTVRPISTSPESELPTKTVREPTQAPRRVSNWQEISSEINRFAEENMKSSGENFWLSKNNLKRRKEEVDENSLSYLSSESIENILKREMVFQVSQESQRALQAWDTKMGLKKSHSRMMTRSSVTRRKMLRALKELRRKREKV